MKRSARNHPKMKDLVARLRIPIYAANGIVERLWHFAAEFAPRGDVGRYPDATIAEDIGWKGSAQGLIAALQACGWLDPHPVHRLVVHDWHEHCDQAVRRRVERAGLTFILTSHRLDMASQQLDMASPRAQAEPELEPEPEPEPEPPRATPAATAEQPGSDPEPITLAEQIRERNERGWPEFVEAITAAKMPCSSEDLHSMHARWELLPFQDRLDAVRGVFARIEAGEFDDPAYVPNAANYLRRRQWERAIRPRAKPDDHGSRLARMIAEA